MAIWAVFGPKTCEIAHGALGLVFLVSLYISACYGLKWAVCDGWVVRFLGFDVGGKWFIFRRRGVGMVEPLDYLQAHAKGLVLFGRYIKSSWESCLRLRCSSRHCL